MTYSLFLYSHPTGIDDPIHTRLSRTLRQNKIAYQDMVGTPIYALYTSCLSDVFLQSEQLQLVCNLLDATTEYSYLDKSEIESAWVLSRPEVESPWSSKALDILSILECKQVSKIVSGILWQGKNLATKWCYDQMTQVLYSQRPDLDSFFATPATANPTVKIDGNRQAINAYNTSTGLGLSQDEVALLANFYQAHNRLATDAELMMFAQINSEHCRHKIFNASWNIDGKECLTSLFDYIRSTTRSSTSKVVLSAYSDNAAVMRGSSATRLMPDQSAIYHKLNQDLHICLKAETHNHPTAIAPFEGAATGIGGEIRDEAATGLGAMPKAGWCGFVTANLRLPNLPMQWEKSALLPNHASALSIMTEAPMGGANYGNEFGRPNLMGFFRTLETHCRDKHFAFYKPIMLAGGIASIEQSKVLKTGFSPDTLLVVLGGPAFKIGLGGGSASSATQGSNTSEIDFSSVQRDNAEMQRRCQMVIDTCSAAANNPIASIHDIGAGGLSNAFPELVADCKLGARIYLEKVPCNDTSMSPMEIWCNESQERYALAINPSLIDSFIQYCAREHCPYAIIGKSTSAPQLVVTWMEQTVIDMPMEFIFGSLAKLQLTITTANPQLPDLCLDVSLEEALVRVLACPSVASKEFLVTIADRSISGMVAGEAMIGPWQVPVADCALTLDSPLEHSGQAFALGEKIPLAISNSAAASRMAIAESLTNLASCGEVKPHKVILSANWMASPDTKENSAELHSAVVAASNFCGELGIAIPVGKDSLSMRSQYTNGKLSISAEAPVSLVISALTQINNLSNRLTPQLMPDGALWLIEPKQSSYQLGNSALAQVYDSFGTQVPDITADKLSQLLNLINQSWSCLTAYHDRSDGGVWASLCEMAFASGCGLNINCNTPNPIEFLLNEGIGVVVQVKPECEDTFAQLSEQYPLLQSRKIATPAEFVTANYQGEPNLTIKLTAQVLRFSLNSLFYQWQSQSYALSLLRDNPKLINCAQKTPFEITHKLEQKTTFTLFEQPAINLTKPRIAILRERGSNGHRDMAYAFDAAGFEVLDLTMQDLRDGYKLGEIQGLVACGGFSYGDVAGGGNGWAQGIIHNQQVFETLQLFWNRTDTFILGVCNGCQMLTHLSDYLPGSQHFKPLKANNSGRFEGRLIQLKINNSPSVLLAGMQGAQLVVPIAHGYGRFTQIATQHAHLITARYCNQQGEATQNYPANPNGSTDAIGAITNTDGRITITMVHPERAYLTRQCPWQHQRTPSLNKLYSPWFRVFQNAYNFVK